MTTTTDDPGVRLDRSRPEVWIVTLDRPARLNALTFEMFDELARLWEHVAADVDVRAVVITGAGRGFCAGLDLDEAEQLADMDALDLLRSQESWAAAVTGARRVDVPVIAAVNGPAAGAGMALALAADLRVASPSATFNAAFVRIGLTGGDCGTSWLLPRIVGLGHAAELLLTGRVVDADEAHRIGLVNHLVGDDGLVSGALELASQVLANSPSGVALTKDVLQRNVDAPSLDAALALENRNQVLATRGPQMPEALAAFRQGRPPRFVP